MSVTPGALEETATADPMPLMLGLGWFPDQAGGLNRYFRDLHTTLSLAGTPPPAVVIGPAGVPAPGVAVASDAARPLLARLVAYLAAARRAGRRADLVDAHFALYASPLLLSGLRNRPLVVHFHGPWAQESASSDQGTISVAAKRALERWVYRSADRIVVLSGAFRRTLVESYGVPPWRIVVVPPGVDLDYFTPGDGWERKRLGLPEGCWTAVVARRLVQRMGIDVLLRAWADLSADGHPGLLIVIGEGPMLAGLESLAGELGVLSSVRFTGLVDDDELRDWYRAADVCVVPSRELEGFGLVVIESLACGTPTVVTDVGGLREATNGLGSSVVVPAGDSGALASRLRAARDGTAPLPSSHECRAHAERFSWDAAVERHRPMYRSVVSPMPRIRPRVVFLDHCAELSGGELCLARTIPLLRNIDAHVVLAEDGPLVALLEGAGVSVEVFPMDERARGLARGRVSASALPLGAALGSATHVARLVRRLRRLAPDIVHTFSLKAAVYGLAAGRLAGVPVVWHLHDRIAPDYLPSTTVRFLRGIARSLPSAIIANSRTTFATLPPVRCPVAVIPSPVARAAQARRGVAPASGNFRVGLVGRIAPWKGQDLFLEGFARAFPSGLEEAVLVGAPLFGEDDYWQVLHGTANRLGLGDRVDFRGFREDVPAELARLDVLVHGSTIPEPLGQTVLEGMAAGLPVVVPDAGGPAEIVSDDLNGLHYRLGDADSMAQALVRLRADDELRERLGASALEALEPFSPRTVAAQIEALYRTVLRPPSRGTSRR